MKQLFVLLVALVLLLTQCQKSDSGPAKPEDQLPPATQTGAGTFGCLLNGQPWTPSGNYGPANFRLDYDPSYTGGSLTIRAYQALSGQTTKDFLIGGSQIAKKGTYTISNNANCGAAYSLGTSGSCGEYNYYNRVPGFTMRGQLTITRLDRIVSGTFNFTLAQTGCDTIKVTQGRFDYTL